MNYRHAYHAGNFADVVKHAVLALVIEHLKLKPAPFRVIDTHAGIGVYDLTSEAAQKTGEWREGIGRLMAAKLSPAAAEVLAPYLDIVRRLNPGGALVRYPGSPLLARELMRADDRLVVNELHPEDQDELKRHFAHDPQVRVMALDAWTALKALLPPPERRGVMLIDPAFEQTGELDAPRRRIEGSGAPLCDGHVPALVSHQGGRACCRLPSRSGGARVSEGDGDRVDDPRVRRPDTPQRRRPHRRECAVYFVFEARRSAAGADPCTSPG